MYEAFRRSRWYGSIPTAADVACPGQPRPDRNPKPISDSIAVLHRKYVFIFGSGAEGRVQPAQTGQIMQGLRTVGTRFAVHSNPHYPTTQVRRCDRNDTVLLFGWGHRSIPAYFVPMRPLGKQDPTTVCDPSSQLVLTPGTSSSMQIKPERSLNYRALRTLIVRCISGSRSKDARSDS